MQSAETFNEMHSALHDANECSAKLELLLQEIRSSEKPSPEIMQEVMDVNKSCEAHMKRYLKAYAAYYGSDAG